MWSLYWNWRDDVAIVDFHYKSEQSIPFLVCLTKWYHRKKTRQAAQETLNELCVLRNRLSDAVVEISEWRAKIGEAAYSRPGPVFAEMVEAGIRNRIGTWLSITDEDYYPRG